MVCERTACPPRSPADLLNGFPCSAFAQNVGLVGLTGVRSRFVVAVSGLILVVLGLFPKLGAVIASLPLPVTRDAGSRRRHRSSPKARHPD